LIIVAGQALVSKFEIAFGCAFPPKSDVKNRWATSSFLLVVLFSAINCFHWLRSQSPQDLREVFVLGKQGAQHTLDELGEESSIKDKVDDNDEKEADAMESTDVDTVKEASRRVSGNGNYQPCKSDVRYPQTKLFHKKSLGSCASYRACNEDDQKEITSFLHNLDLSHVRYYLQFWGQGRTGHSWIGSAIDAAPDALVANEFNTWQSISSFGTQRLSLFRKLAQNSFICGMYGRIQIYDYTIPNTSQGLVGEGYNVTVVGDKRGGFTTRAFWSLGFPWTNETVAQLQHKQYKKLKDLVGPGIAIKNIFVLRNPFDMIATQVLRQTESRNPKILPDRIIASLQQLRQVLWAIDNLDNDWFVFSMEAFAIDTETEFRSICAWLEITCDSIIEVVVNETHHSVHETRHEVEWTGDTKEVINEFISTHLSDYYEKWL